MGKAGVDVKALVGELIGEGVITKNVGDFTGVGLLVGEPLLVGMNGVDEARAVPRLILVVEEGTGVAGGGAGWLRTNRTTAMSPENEPATTYQRALAIYL